MTAPKKGKPWKGYTDRQWAGVWAHLLDTDAALPERLGEDEARALIETLQDRKRMQEVWRAYSADERLRNQTLANEAAALAECADRLSQLGKETASAQVATIATKLAGDAMRSASNFPARMRHVQKGRTAVLSGLVGFWIEWVRTLDRRAVKRFLILTAQPALGPTVVTDHTVERFLHETRGLFRLKDVAKQASSSAGLIPILRSHSAL